jgi:hypothetical protein
MMNTHAPHRYLLAGALFFSSSALADEAQATKVEAVENEATTKVATSGSAKLGVNLYDSTRVDTPDVDALEANLGVKASKGPGDLNMKIHFTPSEPVATSVNELNVNLALPANFGLGVGRYDLGLITAKDSRPRGLVDAARASYTLALAKEKQTTLHLYYGNTLQESANFASQAVKTQWRAYGARLTSTWTSWTSFEIKYATEPNRLTSFGEGTPPSGTVQPWMLLGWSVEGGKSSGLSLRAYGELESFGQGYALEATRESHRYKTGDKVATAPRSRLMTVGSTIAIHSLMLNSFMELTSEYRETTINSKEAGNDTRIVGKLGYDTGVMQTWIEYEHHWNDKTVYTTVENKPTKELNYLRWITEYSF